MNTSKKFNLIVSLGGSCYSAHNIDYRNLRYCSLPFDWFFIKDETPIIKLAECFQNDFKYFMKQENLKELIGDEKGTDDGGHYQYKDLYSEYRTIHSFKKSANDIKEYLRVKKILDKRISRMYSLLSKSKSVMFVIDSRCPIQMENLKRLIDIVKEKFDINHIEIHSLQLNSDVDEDINEDNVYIYKRQRSSNAYDIEKTNYDWKFLDSIVLETLTSFSLKIKNYPLLVLDKIKKGISIYLFPQISTLFRIRLYLLGIRIDFCIGKVRA